MRLIQGATEGGKQVGGLAVRGVAGKYPARPVWGLLSSDMIYNLVATVMILKLLFVFLDLTVKLIN